MIFVFFCLLVVGTSSRHTQAWASLPPQPAASWPLHYHVGSSISRQSASRYPDAPHRHAGHAQSAACWPCGCTAGRRGTAASAARSCGPRSRRSTISGAPLDLLSPCRRAAAAACFARRGAGLHRAVQRDRGRQLDQLLHRDDVLFEERAPSKVRAAAPLW